MNLLIKWLINTLGIMVAAYVLPGVAISSTSTALLAALVLGLLNTFIRPILILLTLPLNIVTLGLFTFVINAAIVLWVGSLVSGFVVTGFWSAVLFSLIVSIVTSFFHFSDPQDRVGA